MDTRQELIKKPVLLKRRIAAQASLWEPKLLGRQERRSPPLAVQSSSTYPERRRLRRQGRLRRGLLFFRIRNVFSYLIA